MYHKQGVGLRVYSIKQVSAMTGLTAARVRAWERRYAVVRPRRTEGQYRMYSEVDVQRLRTMAQLVDSGVGAQHAANMVTAGARERPGVHGSGAPADFVDAATRFDVVTMAQLLHQAIGLDEFEERCDTWLAQVGRELSARHRVGALEDVHVTCAEQVIVQYLDTLLDESLTLGERWEEARISDAKPMLLIAQQEPSSHTILPLMLAVSLRRNGVDVRRLGRGVRASGWLRAVGDLGPRAVAIISTTARGRRMSQDIAAQLRALNPPVQVWLGGEGHDTTTSGVLPYHLAEATQRVLAQLRGGTRE
ncbi:MerR family transcriptional regulator [Propionibacteriaceae bacterium G57]|uniref:MerR family transcriptional regulator n=1 Tax=Aestuariimicrobium sp. G57 TaxID=3418485 RepID=UPI003DA6EB27